MWPDPAVQGPVLVAHGLQVNFWAGDTTGGPKIRLDGVYLSPQSKARVWRELQPAPYYHIGLGLLSRPRHLYK